MAITTTDGLVSAIASGQDAVISKASVTGVAGFWYSLFFVGGAPATAAAIGNTTSGVIPTDATAGAPIINAFTGANTGYLAGFDVSNTVAGAVRLYDRLYHVGPISGLALATTTFTGQPTLTRLPSSNTGGIGLELWLEVTTTFSATATTVTVGYTNSSGTSGRTATLDIASLSGQPVNRMFPFRLQAGDLGVQRVDNVVVGGVVSTTGAFNLVLLRTVAEHNVMAVGISEPRQDPFKTGLPPVYADSCLVLMMLCTTSSTGSVIADFDIING